jgi:hypothetical protein
MTLSPEHQPAHTVVDRLARALSERGPFDPVFTRIAATGFNALATYLNRCLSTARLDALPTLDDLAALSVALHQATTDLAEGLKAIPEDIEHHDHPTQPAQPNPTQAAQLRSALSRASHSLRQAAAALADTHQAIHPSQPTTPATEPPPPPANGPADPACS